MVAVGEHLVLHRQEGAAGIHQVHARQPILERDLLGAQVLLDRHRVVGAALDGGVVGDHDHVPAGHRRDPGDDPGAGGIAAVELRGRQRRQLEERRAGVREPLDAVAHEQLAAALVPLARTLASPLPDRLQAILELGDQRQMALAVSATLGAGPAGRPGARIDAHSSSSSSSPSPR